MSEPAPQSDISLLFATDPLKLTREDRAPIIAYFRENRLKYLAGEKQVRATPAPKQKSKGPLPDIELELDL